LLFLHVLPLLHQSWQWDFVFWSAPVAVATYAKVFEEEGALDKLEAFASLNGPRHYKLPENSETITIEKSPWTAPEEVKVDGPDDKALVYRGGETIEWKVVQD